jgi:hypothetical protein
MSGTVAVGLQEWAAVCSGLGDGRLMLSLRKGGIHERGGGLFAPDHLRFALLPSHLHQTVDRVATGLRSAVAATSLPPVPGRIRVSHWAEVARTWRCRDLLAVQALAAESPYTPAEIATRFHYRDEPQIFVLALRIHRLPVPVEIVDDPAYAGCRSWIELNEAIATAGSVPVLDPGFFGARLGRIATLLDQAGHTPP